MTTIESKLQIACVKWFRLQYPGFLLCSFPMGGFRNKITGRILKAEGALAGSPDLFLFLSNGNYYGLAIEMKTAKGVQSETQKAFEKKLKRFGYQYVICRSFQEFKIIIENYIYKL